MKIPTWENTGNLKIADFRTTIHFYGEKKKTKQKQSQTTLTLNTKRFLQSKRFVTDTSLLRTVRLDLKVSAENLDTSAL